MVRPRTPPTRPLRSTFIYCEGDRTEPGYFSMFRREGTSIIINEGKARNAGGEAGGLKALAEARLRSAGFRKGSDRIWIVLDKDENRKSELSGLRQWCESNGVGLALTNPCFEFWLLLHFDYHEEGQDCRAIVPMLSRRLGTGYRKEADYNHVLRGRVDTAVRNARTLRRGIPSDGYCDHNPFTNLDLLVDELRRRPSSDRSPRTKRRTGIRTLPAASATYCRYGSGCDIVRMFRNRQTSGEESREQRPRVPCDVCPAGLLP